MSAVIVAGRRSAVGTSGMAFKDLSVSDLLAPVLADVAMSVGDHVDDVVIGVARGPGGNVARLAALQAGLGVDVAGVTVDRQCGSGLAAIQIAASMVAAGHAQIVLAGGAESGTYAAPGRAAFAPSDIGDPDMGPAAEAVAQHWAITRERQDAYAARSHARALAHATSIAAEIVPIAGVIDDQRPRAISEAVLSRMPAAFSQDGTVTAGNSCGVSDGAAVVAVVSEEWRAKRGIPGLAIRGWTAVGVDPNTPGVGPLPAARELLARCDVSLDDVDVIEIVEAFAAQVLAVMDELGLDALGADAQRVCPRGGAIALGHPWGASGALIVVRLLHEMLEAGQRYGLALCAVGGGQGLAMLLERVGP